MTLLITTLIWISFTSFLFFKHIKIEKELADQISELGNEIAFLNEKIFELSPQGYAVVLCDRKNPWHTTVHWYLKELELGTREFSESEIKHYSGLVELNKWYLIYRDQPLQGYRNNSMIWEKAWCHKWSDGLGPYGLGHDHWVAGEFEYHFKTNTEFATWLTNEAVINK